MHNGRWIVATIVVAAITSEAARADMGYLPPVNGQMRFDNLDDHPSYDFYLKYGHGEGNPYASLYLTRVTSGTLHKLEGQGRRLTEVYLLAVPRGRPATPPPEQSGDGQWLGVPQSGTLQSPPLSLTGGGSPIHYYTFTATYHVSVEGDQLIVTWVSGEEKRYDGWFWYRWACAGFALSSLIAFIGLVWIRRRRRRLKT